MGLDIVPLPRQMEISVDYRKISEPRVFDAPAEGVPLEFCNGGSACKKTSVMSLTVGGKKMTICASFTIDTIPQFDGVTDGFAESISRRMHSTACYFYTFSVDPEEDGDRSQNLFVMVIRTYDTSDVTRLFQDQDQDRL